MTNRDSQNRITRVEPESVLIYVYDPMCSWCYGFRKTWKILKNSLPQTLPVVSLLGGLAGDSTEPMQMEMVDYIERTWIRISEICNVEFNHEYWRQNPPPPRTTFIACRAVIAAEGLAGRGEAFAERIQDAYYKEARNVWDGSVLIDLAVDFGFCRDAFNEALYSNHSRGIHDEQRALAERLNMQSYPSLLLFRRGEGFPIPVRHGDSENMLQDIQDLLTEPNA